MKLMVASLVGMLALSGVAQAQSAPPSKGYIEGIAQSAFGNVTSQSFGAEGGVSLTDTVQVFAEFGMVRDTAPDTLGPAAQKIAVALGSGSSYSVAQPVGFGLLGLRYNIPMEGRALHPYLSVGGGLASVKRDVAFLVNGTDVTEKLDTYGVVLGSDLAGTERKLMISGGVGLIYNITRTFLFDANYRFGRIQTDGTATNVQRVGAGIGFRF